MWSCYDIFEKFAILLRSLRKNLIEIAQKNNYCILLSFLCEWISPLELTGHTHWLIWQVLFKMWESSTENTWKADRLCPLSAIGLLSIHYSWLIQLKTSHDTLVIKFTVHLILRDVFQLVSLYIHCSFVNTCKTHPFSLIICRHASLTSLSLLFISLSSWDYVLEHT